MRFNSLTLVNPAKRVVAASQAIGGTQAPTRGRAGPKAGNASNPRTRQCTLRAQGLSFQFPCLAACVQTVSFASPL
eukprot:2479969-Alexandrium_andersonii.AAC.1